jgi:pSer/pThr/pTyr-binding forkhead associated (FHA) protein
VVGEGTLHAGASAAALRLPAGKRVSLAIVDGPQKGRVFPFDQPRLVIGRAAGGVGAQVELTDPEASRTHAVVECRGSRIMVRDLGSTNGTFIGPRRIAEADLEDHGEFRIGRTRLMLIITDEE